MNKQGNTYTFLYASIMVVVVAVVLAFVSTTLKPRQIRNAQIAKKISILKSANIESDFDNAEEMFDKYITGSTVIDSKGNVTDDVAFEVPVSKKMDKFPIYTCRLDSGKGDKVIVPLYGTGLWGPVWGYISFDSDLNTVYGATFDHKSETPGLGAEISQDKFQKQFPGKTIFDQSNTFTSVKVLKGNNSDNPHAVDGISGGTLTSNGVSKMLEDCLSRYEKYFKQNKK